MAAIDDAYLEYVDKHEYPGKKPIMHRRRDGLYEADTGDQCMLCIGLYWPNDSGAHLKTVEHIARKHGASLMDLKRLATHFDMVSRANRISAAVLQIPSVSPTSAQALHAYINNDLGITPEEEPILLEPTTAFGWKSVSLVINNDGELEFDSPSQSFAWTPYAVMQAKCHKVGGKACMKPDCSCGFYFYWDADKAIEYDSTRQVIVAAQLGGVLVEHELGCRAEYASLIGVLYTAQDGNSKRLQNAAARYGIPIVDKEGNVIP